MAKGGISQNEARSDWLLCDMVLFFYSDISRFGLDDVLNEEDVKDTELIEDKYDLNALHSATMMKYTIDALVEDKRYEEALSEARSGQC